MSAPRFLDAGESALVVEFGARIDPALHGQVLALDRALLAVPPEGLIETVPTYRSLMVHYDPLVLARAELIAAVERALAQPGQGGRGAAHWRIPACYDAEFAEDLPFVAEACGMSEEAVIAAHCGARFRVAMYGFAPGWAYLDGLPGTLALPRRAAPRARIRAGSLIIAGGQAIIAGPAMPSGWHILGRTPLETYAPGRDPAFLLGVGDTLEFRRVDRAAFEAFDGGLSPDMAPGAAS